MAEQLLETSTQSVINRSFSRLTNLSTVGSNVTIEEMMRDMLRPMLKEWLDENLPTMVERMVEQEIARVSRGGR
jgi:cell pole-organizing protein PopZ